MKKIIYILFATIIITSCKKTDSVVNTDTQPQPQQIYVLPTKITIIDVNGTNTSSFAYNGNKLVGIVGATSNVTYTYTGNLVSKITITNSGAISSLSTEDYSYNPDSTINSVVNYSEILIGGQLTKDKSITRFTYNTNGTVSQRAYSIDLNSGTETASNSTILNTFINNNISIKYTETAASFNITNQTLEYDLKNSPYKNILGYKRLFKERSNANNLLKQTNVFTTYFNGQTIMTTDVLTRTYVYNSDNFPTEIKYFSSTGTLTGTIQFAY
jgi:hypothetical protein